VLPGISAAYKWKANDQGRYGYHIVSEVPGKTNVYPGKYVK
jgi:hypothetical protein